MHDTLDAWLSHISNCHFEDIALGLARIGEVAKRLECDQFDCPIVHVAGTNGKGTCVNALRAIYQKAGYRTGMTISPHLLKVNERIVIDDKMVSDDDLMATFSDIETKRAEADIDLTYFEYVILAALLLFKRAKVDIILLEVGVGGRLDATNIISSTIGVITSIGMDHQAYLGSTLEAIAGEKAGIIKPGMQGVVLADVKAQEVILAKAEQEGVEAYLLGRDFEIDFPVSERYVPSNIACACQVVSLLQPRLKVNDEDLVTAIKHLDVAGRLQQINIPQSVVLDVAHNEDSVRVLAERIEALKVGSKKDGKTKKRLIAIFSAMTTRDPGVVIKPIQHLVDAWWLPKIENPSMHAPIVANMHAPTFLSEILHKIGIQNHSEFANMEEVLGEIIHQDLEEAFFVVFGSFYTVSAFLDALAFKEKELYGQ